MLLFLVLALSAVEGIELNNQRVVTGRVDAHALESVLIGGTDLDLTLTIYIDQHHLQSPFRATTCVDKGGFFLFEVPPISGTAVLSKDTGCILAKFYVDRSGFLTDLGTVKVTSKKWHQQTILKLLHAVLAGFCSTMMLLYFKSRQPTLLGNNKPRLPQLSRKVVQLKWKKVFFDKKWPETLEITMMSTVVQR